MIKYMTIEQLDEVIDIWYQGNVETHKDIDPNYWMENKEFVKEAMSNANIYVSMSESRIEGFLGVVEGYYIAGLFVRADCRGKGIGKSLLDYAKTRYTELALDVYKSNNDAIRFYLREAFVVEEESIDENTGQVECTMVWPKNI